MTDRESKHDKVLSRVHLWLAVLGGAVTLTIGVYNVKNIFFPSARPVAQIQEDAPAPHVAKPAAPTPAASYANFKYLDLDGNGALSDREKQPVSFEALDRDGDGFLTRLEWHMISRVFNLYDMNGDGRISPEEFSVRDR